MAEFIHGNQINLALEEMIKSAEEYLVLVSPYIKLHDRLKAELKARIEDHKLKIIILFGKNEGEAEKSVKREDIDFFIQFPNIKICYEKNLHAKYYACENNSLLTSMNLHQFSQNNNIETGILMQPKGGIEQLANILVTTQDIDRNANDFFINLINRSDVIYESIPQYKKEMLGLSKKYVGAEIKINKVEEFFKKKSSHNNDYTMERPLSNSNHHTSNTQSFKKSYNNNTAFCIRTGVPIPFNRDMPFCEEAFNTWSQFANQDYPEKYCHSTGKPSYGKTSMRNPILGV